MTSMDAQARSLTNFAVANNLNESIRKYIEDKARLCQPDNIQVCDGSELENQELIDIMVKEGVLEKLDKYENW